MQPTMRKPPLRFGRYDVAAFAAFTVYSVCSFSIPLTLVAIGNSLDFPLDRGGMGAAWGRAACSTSSAVWR